MTNRRAGPAYRARHDPPDTLRLRAQAVNAVAAKTEGAAMPESRDRIDEILAQLTEIKDDVHTLKEQSAFWHRPPVEGARTRAQQVQDLLDAIRAGRLVSRGLLWIAGAIIAFGAAVPHVRGWIGK